MAESRIEWTDTTWNPVAGCSIMSAGCKNCYAMSMAKRLEAMGIDKYSGLTRKSGKRIIWNNKVRLDENSLELPYRWRKPRNVFVNSMSDLFHEKVSDDFVEKIWRVMSETPQHNYQILTKRPDRMAHLLQSRIRITLPNVWLGTSVENSALKHRIDQLRSVPASVRFISFEPLIGPVGKVSLRDIHWAIVGGESGSAARPIKETWIDEIHHQCREYEVAFFFKQWGTWGADNKKRSKKANGRTYRGKTWDEMPAMAG
ncbi:MAG: phage Gp37/Gp68 family protein [Pseudomonadota bacterium]